MQSNVFERSVDNAPLIACLSKQWRNCLTQQKDSAVHYILGEVRIGFWNYLIQLFVHLIIYTSFINFWQTREYTFCLITFSISSILFFENGYHICIF